MPPSSTASSVGSWKPPRLEPICSPAFAMGNSRPSISSTASWPDFAGLIDPAESDLSEEMTRGGHDEKIGSERESEQLLELLGRIRNLMAQLPAEGHVDQL